MHQSNFFPYKTSAHLHLHAKKHSLAICPCTCIHSHTWPYLLIVCSLGRMSSPGDLTITVICTSGFCRVILVSSVVRLTLNTTRRKINLFSARSIVNHFELSINVIPMYTIFYSIFLTYVSAQTTQIIGSNFG